MRATCPSCGAIASIEAWLADAEARQVVSSAFSIPGSCGPSLLRYLSLFRPPQRALSWARALRLLQELEPCIREARLSRHGRVWAAPQAYWLAALEQVLAARDEGRLQLPLKSHGYLYEIVVGLSSKAEAQAERGEQQERAYPYSRVHVPDAPLSQGIPAAIKAQLARFRGKGGSGEDQA